MSGIDDNIVPKKYEKVGQKQKRWREVHHTTTAPQEDSRTVQLATRPIPGFKSFGTVLGRAYLDTTTSVRRACGTAAHIT